MGAMPSLVTRPKKQFPFAKQKLVCSAFPCILYCCCFLGKDCNCCGLGLWLMCSWQSDHHMMIVQWMCGLFIYSRLQDNAILDCLSVLVVKTGKVLGGYSSRQQVTTVGSYRMRRLIQANLPTTTHFGHAIQFHWHSECLLRIAPSRLGATVGRVLIGGSALGALWCS